MSANTQQFCYVLVEICALLARMLYLQCLHKQSWQYSHKEAHRAQLSRGPSPLYCITVLSSTLLPFSSLPQGTVLWTSSRGPISHGVPLHCMTVLSCNDSTIFFPFLFFPSVLSLSAFRDLSLNELSGTIPSQLSTFTSLQYLCVKEETLRP